MKDGGKEMDAMLKADRDWEKILDGLKYQARFDLESGLGYKDLKDEKNREFLRGMAWMYNELVTAGDTILDPPEDDAPILQRIRTEIGEWALGELRAWFVASMEEMLTAMLDEEAEDGDEAE